MKEYEMPKEECCICGGPYQWTWEEAFEKFGFGDGDGMVMTDVVADVLRDAGYECITEEWGFHNTVIVSIKKQDLELIPRDNISFGYDSAREYLPDEIVQLLDKELPYE